MSVHQLFFWQIPVAVVLPKLKKLCLQQTVLLLLYSGQFSLGNEADLVEDKSGFWVKQLRQKKGRLTSR